LSAQAPGADLQDGKTLLSAVSLVNCSTSPAQNVRVTSIKLSSGKLASSTATPQNLGDIPPGGFAAMQADFSGGPFERGANYRLAVQGTYSVGKATRSFVLNVPLRIPRGAPGSAELKTTKVDSHSVKGGRYPHQAPKFNERVNGPRWTVPKGPVIPGKPTSTSTAVEKALIGDPPAIDFEVNNGLGISGSTTAEPSGASGGGVVFVTSNWYAAYSTDGGATFTQLDPTTIFPADAIGYCCDQIVQYVPSVDRFIWLLQGNGMRLASARPTDIITSHGTAWTYWNLTPDVFGQPAGTGVDYPDLAVGDNSLYLTWDVGWPACPAGCNSGREVVRASLAQIQASGTIGLGYTTPSDSSNAWGGHISQNTGNEVFWAGHNNTSSIRIYSLMEGSGTYFWQDVRISSWSNTGLTSSTPDGQDWMNKLSGFPGSAVIGLTRVGNRAWFGWSAGTDSNFRQPHIELLTLNTDNNNPPNLGVNQQVQVWNNNYAFGYPALAANQCTKEVGMSFEYGGKADYENHVVGFWGDFIAYITTGTNVGTTRFGDYVTIRQSPPTKDNPGNLFDAFGYGLNKTVTGTNVDVHYVLFGRPAKSCK
jgi:hypothetical protein